MRIIWVVLALAFMVCANAQTELELWNMYRATLKDNLSAYFCKLKNPGHNVAVKTCSQLQNTILQMVDDPMDATFVTNPHDLNEQLAKFTPKVSASFALRCASYDCSFLKVYQDALARANDANAYLKFRKAPTVSFPEVQKSYPWSIINTMPAELPGHVIASVSHYQTTVGTIPWGHVGSYSGPKHFIRQASGAHAAAVMSDRIRLPAVQEKESNTKAKKYSTHHTNYSLRKLLKNVELENMGEQSDSSFLLRRRRRRRNQAPPPVPVIISTKQFEMTFTASSLTLYQIAPGEWFDRNFLTHYRGVLREFFDHNHGSMPLIPSVVFVANNPKVTLKITNTVYVNIAQQLNINTAQVLRIGGLEFKGSNVRTLGDDVYELYDTEGIPGDIIRFTPIEEANEEQETESKEEDVDAILTMQDAEAESDSNFLFRRRRRAPPPRPPPPPPPPKVFTHIMTVESHTPQIVAIVSEYLP